jgi:hypothetical protein
MCRTDDLSSDFSTSTAKQVTEKFLSTVIVGLLI